MRTPVAVGVLGVGVGVQVGVGVCVGVGLGSGVGVGEGKTVAAGSAVEVGAGVAVGGCPVGGVSSESTDVDAIVDDVAGVRVGRRFVGETSGWACLSGVTDASGVGPVVGV
jgi:hypothetical protein